VGIAVDYWKLVGESLGVKVAFTPELFADQLEVKLTVYMITAALSQYNKGGDPEMERWTARQPDRIYQFSVEPEGIAAYLRVRAGQTKAGRGVYERRRPFVHMRFHGVDGALAVMNREVDFVDGVSKGFVRIDGSPEYAANLNDFMMRLQGLLTGRGARRRPRCAGLGAPGTGYGWAFAEAGHEVTHLVGRGRAGQYEAGIPIDLPASAPATRGRRRPSIAPQW